MAHQAAAVPADADALPEVLCDLHALAPAAHLLLSAPALHSPVSLGRREPCCPGERSGLLSLTPIPRFAIQPFSSPPSHLNLAWACPRASAAVRHLKVSYLCSRILFSILLLHH